MFKRIALLAFVALCLIGAVASADWGGWQGPVNPSGGPISADMIVRQEGTMTVVWSESAGKDVYSSTAATAAIQYALDHVSGTVQEKVVVNGAFTGLDSLLIRSHTSVELAGSLTSKATLAIPAGSNGRFAFFISNRDSGTAHDISIYGASPDGGTIRCLTDTCNILRFKGVTRLYVSNLHIIGTYVGGVEDKGIGIETHKCNYGVITNCTIDSTSYDGIMLWESEHFVTSNCLIRRAVSNGFQWDHCRYCVATGLTIDSCQSGVRIAHSACSLNVFTGGTITGIDNWSSYGMELRDAATKNIFTNTTIKSVLVAFRFPNHPSNAPATENYVHDNMVDDCRYFVQMGANGGSDNRIERNQATGVITAFADIDAGSDGNTIADNTVSGTGAGVVTDDGVGTVFEGNTGYVTEAEGRAYLSGNASDTSFSVPYTMSDTANIFTVVPLSHDAAVDFYIGTITASTFRIIWPTAPDSGTENLKFAWTAKARPLITVYEGPVLMDTIIYASSDMYIGENNPTTNFSDAQENGRLHQNHVRYWTSANKKYTYQAFNMSFMEAGDSVVFDSMGFYVDSLVSAVSMVVGFWNDTNKWVAATATWNFADGVSLAWSSWADTAGYPRIVSATLDTVGTGVTYGKYWKAVQLKTGWIAGQTTSRIRMRITGGTSGSGVWFTSREGTNKPYRHIRWWRN